MKAILINSLNTVNFIKEKKEIYKNHLICTVYSSIFWECKKNSIECIDLNSLITNEDIKNEHDTSIDFYTTFLHTLDHKSKELLNISSDLPKMDWFFSLFRYAPLIDYISLNLLKKILFRLIEKFKIDHFTLLGLVNTNSSFLKSEDYNNFIEKCFEEKSIKVEYIIDKKIIQKKYSLKFSDFKEFIKDRILTFRNFIFYINVLFLKKENNVIFLDDVNDNDKKFYCNENTLTLKTKVRKLNPNIPSIKIDELENLLNQDENSNYILDLFKKKFCYHLKMNHRRYVEQIFQLWKIITKYKIKKVYWALPPNIPNIKAVMVDFLIKKNINVLGLQHGGTYGLFEDNDYSADKLHALSDYFFCSTFFSYGNIKLNNKLNSFSKYKLCKFKKIGSQNIKNFIKKNNVENYDLTKKVVFPVNITSSIIRTKLVMASAERCSLIKNIFEILKKDLNNVIVKLYPNISNSFIEQLYPVKIILNQYNKFKICELDFLSSIKKHKPGLIVIEEISTPLYDSIPFNCEIICFTEPLTRIKSDLRIKLEKRIHFVKDIKEFKEKYNLFLNNKLSRKRDKHFLNVEIINNEIS
mgnify:CR=1 FL=1